MNKIYHPKSDYVGKIFGRLTVLERAEAKWNSVRNFWVPYWLCQCSCGAQKIIKQVALKNKITQSCGCLHHDVKVERMKLLNTTHGLSSTPLYTIWHAIKYRTTPGNPGYLGDHILLCDAWQTFEGFLESVGRQPSPEHKFLRNNNRIDDFKPENCSWRFGKTKGRNI